MSGSRSSAPGANAPPEPSADNGDPVSLTVHAMPRVDAAMEAQRTRAGRWKMMLVLAVCAAPVMASYFTFYVVRPEGRNNYAELILPTRTVPQALPLTAMDGAPVTAASLRKQWLLVSAASAACDAACQDRLLMQRKLHQMLGKDRERLDKVWLITDEGTPDPALLAGLTTGDDPVQVLRVPRAALAQWLAPTAGQAMEDHLYVVDPMGEWMMRPPVKPDPQKLKRDLERLLRASSSWDTAGR